MTERKVYKFYPPIPDFNKALDFMENFPSFWSKCRINQCRPMPNLFSKSEIYTEDNRLRLKPQMAMHGINTLCIQR